MNGCELERVDKFCYLGTVINYNGRPHEAMQYNVEKARRALFSLTAYTRSKEINVKSVIELFERMIEPILLYGCETWGHEDLSQIEIFHRRFLKKLLGLHTTAPSSMVYGETGCQPLKYKVWKRMINFWAANVNKTSKITSTFIQLQTKMENGTYRWIQKIREVLEKCDMLHIYEQSETLDINLLKRELKSRLELIAVDEWKDSVNENRLCEIYREHKTTLELEEYLLLLPRRLALNVARFRCATPKLETVKARYSNQRAERCSLCEQTCRPNELHILLKCPQFEHTRPEFLPRRFYTNPTINEYIELVRSNHRETLAGLAKLCDYILGHLDGMLSSVEQLVDDSTEEQFVEHSFVDQIVNSDIEVGATEEIT